MYYCSFSFMAIVLYTLVGQMTESEVLELVRKRAIEVGLRIYSGITTTSGTWFHGDEIYKLLGQASTIFGQESEEKKLLRIIIDLVEYPGPSWREAITKAKALLEKK